MKKLLGIILLACITINIQAQLLWKISGNGLDKPSYILGTHHLAPLSIKDSIAGLPSAFDATTQVIGELKMAEMNTPAILQTMQRMMTTETDTTFKSLFTPEEYDMIAKHVKENLMFDVAMTPKIKPSFLQNNLVVVLYMKYASKFNPTEQLDGYFQKEAANKGKKIVALETPEFQFNLLYNGTSLKRQAEQLLCLLNNIEKAIDQAQRLTASYMNQDLNDLLKLSEERCGDRCDPLPGEMEMLVDNRNKTWGEKLPALIKAEPSFIVVGALHLPGENGLLNLLKKQGYTIEAVK